MAVESVVAGWSRLATTRATWVRSDRTSAVVFVALSISSSVGGRWYWWVSSQRAASTCWLRSATSMGSRMVRPCCWTARCRAWRIHQVA